MNLFWSPILVTSVEGNAWFIKYPVVGSFLGFPVDFSFSKGTNSTPI